MNPSKGTVVNELHTKSTPTIEMMLSSFEGMKEYIRVDRNASLKNHHKHIVNCPGSLQTEGIAESKNNERYKSDTTGRFISKAI